jgi:hypothetical protein
VNTITVADIETGLYRVALAMERAGKRGEVYLPIYERLEEELAALKEKEATAERARKRLAPQIDQRAHQGVEGGE